MKPSHFQFELELSMLDIRISTQFKQRFECPVPIYLYFDFIVLGIFITTLSCGILKLFF